MNVNEKILGLQDVVNCPVEPDEYSGSKERYITFTYEDERPDVYADDKVITDEAYLQVAYFTPKSYDYMDDKHKIRDYLESQGFKVTTIRSWIEDALTGYQKIRHTVFEIYYTETRRK